MRDLTIGYQTYLGNIDEPGADGPNGNFDPIEQNRDGI